MADQEAMEHETDDHPMESPMEPPQPPAEAPQMSTRHEPPYPPPAQPRTVTQPLPQAPQQVRSPILAALFSLFPGLGNVYNGLYLRGVTFFLICFGLIGLAAGSQEPEAVLLVFSVIFVWLFNIFDAYRQASLINFGYPPEMPIKRSPASLGSGGLVAGSAVFLLGFYGFLREVFRIDLTVLADYWYVLFMIFGGFLIAQTIMQRRQAAEKDAADTAELDF